MFFEGLMFWIEWQVQINKYISLILLQYALNYGFSSGVPHNIFPELHIEQPIKHRKF